MLREPALVCFWPCTCACGQIVGLMVCFFGLCSGIFTTFLRGFFPDANSGHLGSFLLFLTLTTSCTALIATLFHRPLFASPGPQTPQRRSPSDGRAVYTMPQDAASSDEKLHSQAGSSEAAASHGAAPCTVNAESSSGQQADMSTQLLPSSNLTPPPPAEPRRILIGL